MAAISTSNAHLVVFNTEIKSQNIISRLVLKIRETRVIRLFFSHVFRKIFPIEFRHYHCCALGEDECTEVYVIPATDLGKWISLETSVWSILPKGEKLYETIAAAREA